MTNEAVLERDKVRRVGMQISFHLEEIAKLLTPDMKLTLLMRNALHPTRNGLMTEETDADAVCRDLRQLMVDPARSMDI